MPRPKGLPKTGGRARGTGNKINRQKEIQKAAEASGQLPLDYMLSVMRDQKATDERRDDMAKAAAPYLHARRAPEDRQVKTVPLMVYTHPPLEADGSDIEETS